MSKWSQATADLAKRLVEDGATIAVVTGAGTRLGKMPLDYLNLTEDRVTYREIGEDAREHSFAIIDVDAALTTIEIMTREGHRLTIQNAWQAADSDKLAQWVQYRKALSITYPSVGWHLAS